MKTLIALCTLMLSASVFAVDFKARIANVDCEIKNGEVTRTFTIGKESKIGFTEKKKVTLNGVESMARKAMETAGQRPNSEEDMAYSMIVDGKTYPLFLNDSRESEMLILTVTKICR